MCVCVCVPSLPLRNLTRCGVPTGLGKSPIVVNQIDCQGRPEKAVFYLVQNAQNAAGQIFIRDAMSFEVIVTSPVLLPRLKLHTFTIKLQSAARVEICNRSHICGMPWMDQAGPPVSENLKLASCLCQFAYSTVGASFQVVPAVTALSEKGLYYLRSVLSIHAAGQQAGSSSVRI